MRATRWKRRLLAFVGGPWFVALVAILGVAAAACGGGEDAAPDGEDPLASATPAARALNPIPANSELVVGPTKFGIGLLDEENQPILGEPGTRLRLRFSFGDELRQDVEARFLWAIPDETGFWRADVDFDEAGQWSAQALLERAGEQLTVSISFPVAADGPVPNVGEPAPPSDTLTLADAPDYLGLSTDPDPEPGMYQLSVADALETGRPLVVVFATPAFCETRFCGPVVDNVQEVYPEFADRVNFVHIEPFELDEQNGLVSGPNGAPLPSTATVEWSLPTEPWVFVIDASGIISVRYEGTVSADELRDALQAIVAG